MLHLRAIAADRRRDQPTCCCLSGAGCAGWLRHLRWRLLRSCCAPPHRLHAPAARYISPPAPCAPTLHGFFRSVGPGCRFLTVGSKGFSPQAAADRVVARCVCAVGAATTGRAEQLTRANADGAEDTVSSAPGSDVDLPDVGGGEQCWNADACLRPHTITPSAPRGRRLRSPG